MSATTTIAALPFRKLFHGLYRGKPRQDPYVTLCQRLQGMLGVLINLKVQIRGLLITSRIGPRGPWQR